LIVLLFRNAASTLPGALAGVRSQTLDRWHLVAVDDHSTDHGAGLDLIACSPQ
jgi:glycosyltransferase involved in cell wall biosynthesis